MLDRRQQNESHNMKQTETNNGI